MKEFEDAIVFFLGNRTGYSFASFIAHKIHRSVECRIHYFQISLALIRQADL